MQLKINANGVPYVVLWGSFSEIQCKPWTERIASGDNPADCLTKCRLDDSHLYGAADVSDDFDWDAIFANLQSGKTQGGEH